MEIRIGLEEICRGEARGILKLWIYSLASPLPRWLPMFRIGMYPVTDSIEIRLLD